MNGKVEGHRAKRQYGQNFLIDEQVIQEIIRIVAPNPRDRIIEIGAGLGALTSQLIESQASVIALEIDESLLPRLIARFAAAPNFELRSQDALTVDYSEIRQSGPKLRIVGNLPYYISTPLLLHFLNALDHIADITVMLQREVTARMVASPGNSDYGRLTVACQACCVVEQVLEVPSWCFAPAPKVDSAVVRLVPLASPPDAALRAAVRWVTQSAFARRRKTIRHSLGKAFSAEELTSCAIETGQRPEEISVPQYLALAAILHRRMSFLEVDSGQRNLQENY